MKATSFNLSNDQKEVMKATGHLLIIGGPGSGKTTVSILKAEQITKDLETGQQILFLSFTNSAVFRVLEAVGQHLEIISEVKKRIEVNTYHSFFWKVIKTHGYLIGLPRRIKILTPTAEAVSLSGIRHEYKAEHKLTALQKEERNKKIKKERTRLAMIEGRVCFDLFADYTAEILNGSNKLRELISTAYPYIVLDEFQDTSPEQWNVVKALGKSSTLISLADPEQRIFDFKGADSERLNHFKKEFFPTNFDLCSANYRSQGTDIVIFGNDILNDQYRDSYNGVEFNTFEANPNQAFASLKGHTLQAKKRLIASGKTDWTLAILQSLCLPKD